MAYCKDCNKPESLLYVCSCTQGVCMDCAKDKLEEGVFDCRNCDTIHHLSKFTLTKCTAKFIYYDIRQNCLGYILPIMYIVLTCFFSYLTVLSIYVDLWNLEIFTGHTKYYIQIKLSFILIYEVFHLIIYPKNLPTIQSYNNWKRSIIENYLQLLFPRDNKKSYKNAQLRIWSCVILFISLLLDFNWKKDKIILSIFFDIYFMIYYISIINSNIVRLSNFITLRYQSQLQDYNTALMQLCMEKFKYDTLSWVNFVTTKRITTANFIIVLLYFDTIVVTIIK